MLAKLLPERHNLYGNSLDFKLNIYKKKKKWACAGVRSFGGYHGNILFLVFRIVASVLFTLVNFLSVLLFLAFPTAKKRHCQ